MQQFQRGQILASIFLFIVAVSAGVGFGTRSWDGDIYVSETSFLSRSRSLANVPRSQNFVQLHMLTEPSTRLISAAEVVLHDGNVGIALGHFVTARNQSGQRQLACDYFDKVFMRFNAEGISEDGETPVMEVEAPCRAADDINKIDTVWIPVQKLLSDESPNDKDLTFDDVNLRFVHMTSQWPKSWRLESVRLYNEKEPERDYRLSEKDLSALLKQPMRLTW